jgi:hypothetical protein
VQLQVRREGVVVLLLHAEVDIYACGAQQVVSLGQQGVEVVRQVVI